MANEWRCKECGTLLGIEDKDNLILRYKEVEYVVTKGQVMAVCRKCRRANVIQIPVCRVKVS